VTPELPSPAARHQAAAIVAAHAALRLDADADPQAEPAADTPAAIAFAAARRLGFAAADAACIGRAWQRQSERLGHFDTAAWPCEAADFGIDPAGAGAAFAPCPPSLGLYAVLPDAAWVARLARAGVPTLQLRFKCGDRDAVRREVGAAVAAVRGSASRLFVNDHWREAIDAGAYGVHLGQEDLAGADLGAIRDAGLRLGISTHGYAEMLRAAACRPSCIALGAVFPTTLKAMATPPQGVARLRVYARLLRGWPLVAIGGIGADQVDAVAATGVGSFAVVRAIVAADDPEAAALDLRRRFETARAAPAPAGPGTASG
jgi:thiamine-phosphate pyrophosphorylase